MLQFAIGYDVGDNLTVEILGRPDERDDWLDANISIRVGAFCGTFRMILLTCDVPPFRSHLESLYNTLNGVANFNTIEDQLKISCTGNGRGGIEVKGICRDGVDDGNELRFMINIDQTFLPSVINSLKQIERQFPNRTHPEFPR